MSRIDRRAFCVGATTAALGLAAGPPGVKLGPGAELGGARPMPASDPWNQDVSRSAVDPRSDILIKSIGLDKGLHPDFGSVYDGRPIGIPYVVVPGTQPRVPVRFETAHESDPGPYPIPPDAPIEGGPNPPEGGDRHVLVLDRDAWKLYELFAAFREGNGWRAGSGAIFDLTRNTTRPAGWTSADAAGLPIFPGLVRHDEAVGAGVIRHALRFTCPRVRRAYVAPARHWVHNLADPDLPLMGMRVRLKKAFDVSKFPPVARVVLEALKAHGMLLADIGGPWFISGAPDSRWDDDALSSLRRVKGRDLEVVKMGRIVTG